VGRLPAHKIDMERFNLKKLNVGEVKEQCQITNKFAALRNLEDNGDINRTWDTIRGKIKIMGKESLSYCALKHHKEWFDEECSKLVEQRKQAKL
jgi:hypothetical protein